MPWWEDQKGEWTYQHDEKLANTVVERSIVTKEEQDEMLEGYKGLEERWTKKVI